MDRYNNTSSMVTRNLLSLSAEWAPYLGIPFRGRVDNLDCIFKRFARFLNDAIGYIDARHATRERRAHVAIRHIRNHFETKLE